MNDKLRSYFLRKKAKSVVHIIFWCFGIVFPLAILASSAIEFMGDFSVPMRTVLFFCVVVAPSLALFVFLLKRHIINQRFFDEAVAKEIGSKLPEIKDKLVNAIQIEKRYGKDNVFVARELKEVKKVVGKYNFLELINFRNEKRLGAISFFTIIATGIIIVISPISEGFSRLIFFSKSFVKPLPYTLQSVSKDIEISKGEDATVRFKILPGKNFHKTVSPSKISLNVVDKDGFEFPSIFIYSDSSGEFSYQLNNQKQTISYYALADQLSDGRLIQSDQYQIKVIDRPGVEVFQVKIVQPAYSRRPTIKLEENFGDATVLRGSKIFFDLKATKLLSSSSVFFRNDSSEIKMKIKGKLAKANFRLMDSKVYSFIVKDKSGLSSKSNNPEYRLRALLDEKPSIRVINPTKRETEMNEYLIENLEVEIQDDYGFSSLLLHHRLAASLYINADTVFKTINIPITSSHQAKDNALLKNIRYEWFLDKLGIVEGDEIEFYFELADNDKVSTTYKTVKSELYKMRAPTLNELYNEVKDKEKEISLKIEEKINQVQTLQEEINRIQDELKQKPRVDWQDKKAIKQLVDKQKEVQSELGKASEELLSLANQMEDRRLFSSETLEKYLEVQKLLKKAAFPEFRKKIEDMQRQLDKMSDRQIRKAMKNMEFNEKQFEQMLDRVKELLMRAQLERKFDELSERLNAMADQEKALSEEMKNSNLDGQSEYQKELEREQGVLAKNQKVFEKEVGETERKMQELSKLGEVPTEDMKNFKDQLSQQKINERMRQVQASMKNKNWNSASQEASNVSDLMRKQSQQIQEIKESLKRVQKQEVIETLRKSVQKALSISEFQEELKQNLDTESSGRMTKKQAQKYAVEQNDVMEATKALEKEFRKASKRSGAMFQTTKQSLQIAQKNMQETMENLERLSMQGGAAKMSKSMESLNKFAQAANDVLESLLSDDGKGEGGQGFGDLANKQSSLNKQTENIFGNQPQRDRKQRLAQLAAQQRMLQQQLQRYKQDQRAHGNENLSSFMERIAEDMEHAAQAMEKQIETREVVVRQKEILSRLLNASRSLRKQEQDEVRKAEAPKDYQKKQSPKELVLEQRTKLQEVLAKLKDYGYSESYEKLIRSYLKYLERKAQ